MMVNFSKVALSLSLVSEQLFSAILKMIIYDIILKTNQSAVREVVGHISHLSPKAQYGESP